MPTTDVLVDLAGVLARDVGPEPCPSTPAWQDRADEAAAALAIRAGWQPADLRAARDQLADGDDGAYLLTMAADFAHTLTVGLSNDPDTPTREAALLALGHTPLGCPSPIDARAALLAYPPTVLDAALYRLPDIARVLRAVGTAVDTEAGAALLRSTLALTLDF